MKPAACCPASAWDCCDLAGETPIETVTDGEGRYRFDNVAAGPVEIEFRLINFSYVRRQLTIGQAPVTANAVMLVAASADITITAPRTFRNLAEVDNPAENLVGVASAGSEGAITAAQLAVRPVNRATEILETVPGLIVSQHSGEGKANQYYLRGFNLDHGFDFAQTIAGIPVNMPTHAHAQGYADANFLIPELVSGVQFRKGPYYAENGDFSSAGSANINYFNVLDRPIVTLRTGSFDYRRLLAAASPKLGKGNLLGAFEYERDNGPWVSPNNKDKYNGVVRYSQGDARSGLSLTFMGFSNHWHSTDQIPQRAVDAGTISRFGFIEETDGGETFRYSGAFDWQRSSTNDSTRATAYVQRYGVQLFHNFTYFMNDPENGDQFEQFERRWTTGGKVTHRHMQRIGGKPTETAFGVDLRNDSVGGPLGAVSHQADGSPLDRPRRRGRSDVGGHLRRDRDRVEPCRAHHLRRARQRLSLERGVDNPLNSGNEASAICQPQVRGGVRAVEGHRALRQLRHRVPLQFGAGHRPARRPVLRRSRREQPGLRPGARRRVRRPHRRDQGTADHRHAVVPRLRLGAGVCGRLRQHGGRPGQPAYRRGDHQLHLSEPVDGDRP